MADSRMEEEEDNNEEDFAPGNAPTKESEDAEPTGRRKQPSSSPPCPEQHTAASCHVQQPDPGSAISPHSGKTAATSSPPAAQDGGPPKRASATSRHPAESTAASSASPPSKGAPGTILDAPSAPDGGASPAASASEPAANESATDAMELTDATPTVSSHQGPDNPAARFLKDPSYQPASRPKPKGKKKQKKRKEPAHVSRSSPGATGDSRRPPATLVTPSVPTAAVQRATPSARESTTYDFTLVQSKRDRRRARALEIAVLPVDPAVVVVRVNHKRNIVVADTTTRECLEELLAVTELHGIPVTARLPAERGKSTGFLHGVVGLPADTDLLGAIESSVPHAIGNEGGEHHHHPIRGTGTP
nr:microtubule-actin cross-linking factor 1, isoforms 6/7-like [Dermacentor andersoni]